MIYIKSGEKFGSPRVYIFTSILKIDNTLLGILITNEYHEQTIPFETSFTIHSRIYLDFVHFEKYHKLLPKDLRKKIHREDLRMYAAFILNKNWIKDYNKISRKINFLKEELYHVADMYVDHFKKIVDDNNMCNSMINQAILKNTFKTRKLTIIYKRCQNQILDLIEQISKQKEIASKIEFEYIIENSAILTSRSENGIAIYDKWMNYLEIEKINDKTFKMMYQKNNKTKYIIKRYPEYHYSAIIEVRDNMLIVTTLILDYKNENIQEEIIDKFGWSDRYKSIKPEDLDFFGGLLLLNKSIAKKEKQIYGKIFDQNIKEVEDIPNFEIIEKIMKMGNDVQDVLERSSVILYTDLERLKHLTKRLTEFYEKQILLGTTAMVYYGKIYKPRFIYNKDIKSCEIRQYNIWNSPCCGWRGCQ